MVEWLCERRRAGDSIAQHGFQHVRPRTGGSARRLLARAHGQRDGEFSGLDDEETRRAVHAGWRVLKLAGIEPDGFVAPAYAYTPALRQTLSLRFSWWAGLLRVHRAQQPLVAGDCERSAATERGTVTTRRGAGGGSARPRLEPRWHRTDQPRLLPLALCAPARCCQPAPCAWTCSPPTCSSRAT